MSLVVELQLHPLAALPAQESRRAAHSAQEPHLPAGLGVGLEVLPLAGLEADQAAHLGVALEAVSVEQAGVDYPHLPVLSHQRLDLEIRALNQQEHSVHQRVMLRTTAVTMIMRRAITSQMGTRRRTRMRIRRRRSS